VFKQVIPTFKPLYSSVIARVLTPPFSPNRNQIIQILGQDPEQAQHRQVLPARLHLRHRDLTRAGQPGVRAVHARPTPQPGQRQLPRLRLRVARTLPQPRLARALLHPHPLHPGHPQPDIGNCKRAIGN